MSLSPPVKPIVRASVREVVTFVLRTGDLAGGSGFAGRNRALEGIRGHQRLQKSRPSEYESEVPVTWRHEEENFIFELKGRIDGVLVSPNSLVIEEIKTTHAEPGDSADPLHWAQAKIYASVYAQERSFPSVTVRITYLNIDSGESTTFEQILTLLELKTFFDSVLSEYLHWAREHQAWVKARNQAIQALAFPFPYRPGQRSLAVAVFRAIKGRGRLFAEAPTGIGKTISVLFPAIKALAEGHAEKLFYLTAKTIGRTVAEETLATLRSTGLSLRAVTITARDKVCVQDGQSCDPAACPYARGYFDRIKPALRDALSASPQQAFDRPTLETIARRHQVCPFELSLDLSVWADTIICDYNYVFDPSASLKRYFDGEKHDYVILTDEAHNLLDRGREMYSADLSRPELAELQNNLELVAPRCASTLGKLCSHLSRLKNSEQWQKREELFVSSAPPEKIAQPIEEFLAEAERWLVQHEASPVREDLLGAYFKALAFQRTLEVFDERYAAILDPAAGNLRLFCLEPASLLKEAVARAGSAIFFSATLRPLDFFRESLGGEPLDGTLALTSPFLSRNLLVLVEHTIATRLRSRGASYDNVVSSIASLLAARSGNYLVFFPSYAYLAEVAARFQNRYPERSVQIQSSGMTEAQREVFLESFASDTTEGLLGFAVLGGIFGEGIDLAGERLIGVVIVGVGLPQISVQRDLIKERLHQKGTPGFDAAYVFPGFTRVLQAVGRVIRSETDRGVILLIDERYRRIPYRKLFPSWWETESVHSPDEIQTSAATFWKFHSDPSGLRDSAQSTNPLAASVIPAH